MRSRYSPPQTVVQLCLVIQELWSDIPHAIITHLIPFMPQYMQGSAWSTWFVTTIIDLAALNSLLHRVNTTIQCCFANDYSRQIADSNHTKQFPREVLTLVKFLDWNWCAFIFCSLCVCVCVCLCLRTDESYHCNVCWPAKEWDSDKKRYFCSNMIMNLSWWVKLLLRDVQNSLYFKPLHRILHLR